MSDYDVDLFVIGGGSGGVRAARIAAQHGARVMLAEEYRMGGTCVIRGCVPKKLLVYAARFHGEFEDAEGYGWTLSHAMFDWPTLIANKEKEIGRLEAASTATLDKAGVKIVKSRAVLADAHTVQLASGERVRAAYVLISTGGGPSERGHEHLSVHLAGGDHIPADCVMFAIGRKPNVSKIGLHEVGVEIAKNGGVAVDEYSRTSVANIHPVGGGTNRVNLTPVAIREGHAFAELGSRSPRPAASRSMITRARASPPSMRSAT